jgi:hypothetical protein
VVVISAPAFAATGGIPGPNPDAPGQINKDNAPLVIKDQGNRTFGGKVIGDPATGQLSCDHGYVDWQTPNNPRKYPLLMVHACRRRANHVGRQTGFPRYLCPRGLFRLGDRSAADGSGRPRVWGNFLYASIG